MSVFKNVDAVKMGRSVFNLSYEKKFDCDMGQLIPVMVDEMVPGDKFQIGNEIVTRFQPLVAPILHDVRVYVHYFFVPTRLLMEDWEEFITGGEDGESSATLPRWIPSDNSMYSLWDYMGFPVGVNPAGAYPLAFGKRAYNLIWNEFYRDQNLQDEVDLDDENVLRRAWHKDYFTSALPWQQRGIAPALPISGYTSAVWNDDIYPWANTAIGKEKDNLETQNSRNYPEWRLASSGGSFTGQALRVSHDQAAALGGTYLNDNTVDLSNATTFDVSDLRLAFQIQKFLERNARAGARYTEFLAAHFGVSPRDERLQRPEYVGGSSSSVIVSEVLQTSSTDATSPQGNLAGHGLTADASRVGSYFAKEFGYMVGILSIIPKANYQQGIDRQWLRRTKYDFYFREFANLSEQAIEQAEIYASGVESENTGIFGYQGRYNEMRYKPSMVCGGLRSTLDYWHLGRQFDTAPALNGSFVECNPSKRIFAVQDEPGIIVSIGNIIRAIRPMPVSPEPGMIDHY